MARYYSFNEKAFRPSQVESSRVKKPKDQAVVSRSGTAPKGYYMAGTQTVSNKAGEKTYNVYRPLQISAAPTPTPTPTPEPTTVTPSIPQYQPQTFDTSGLESQISGLNSQISSLTSGFQSQLGALQTQMQEEREAAAKRMEEMQGSFAQAMAQRGERPRVEGIRFADRGTGGATQQQLQRRGIRGTFGRAGERLMKISSLNV